MDKHIVDLIDLLCENIKTKADYLEIHASFF